MFLKLIGGVIVKNWRGFLSDYMRWRNFSHLMIIAVCLLFNGCASLGEPALTYKEIDHPRSDTAIFAVEGFNDIQDGKLHSVSGIWKVDGKSMRSFSFGSELPVWVRVLPGTHEFEISYSKNGGILRKIAFAKKSVQDMKPRHVYLAKLQDYGETYRIDIEDLGENSAFREHIPAMQSLKPGDHQAIF